MSTKYTFVKEFVESDMNFEEFNQQQLEFFKSQVKELGIEINEMDEENFYIVKETLTDMYSKMQNIIENKESEEITMSKTNTNNNATINNTNNEEMIDMKNVNEEIAATVEVTMGEKAKALAEGVKGKIEDGLKFAVENVDVAADEVKKMANMNDKELEEHLKTNGKAVLDKIVNAVKGFANKSREDGKKFSFFSDVANENADKADNIVELIKEVLDEDGLNGWGKFKAIVKELIKWLLRLLLKVGAIVLKIALTLTVGAIKIGATALVTAGKAIGVVNKEVVKPTVKAGKTAWNNHKERKAAKEAETNTIERELFNNYEGEFED